MQVYITQSFFHLLIFQWSVVKMYARLVIGDFMMVMAFLSVLETAPTFSRNCALLGLCGKVRTSTKPCKLWKTKVVVARQALGAAPRLPSRADTPKFRKRLNTWNVENKAQFSCLVISEKFHINIDAKEMTYDKEQASGNMLSEITFDRIIFVNSLALNGARTKSQYGRTIILEKIWFQYFFLTLRRVLDKKLCLREICLIEV